MFVKCLKMSMYLFTYTQIAVNLLNILIKIQFIKSRNIHNKKQLKN